MTTFTVSSGVHSAGISVSSGNILNVLGGGSATSSTILGGGLEHVFSGGVTDHDTLDYDSFNSVGAVEQLDAGAVANNATVNSGALVNGPGELIAATLNGGTVSNVSIGVVMIDNGGAVDGGVLLAGANLTLTQNATASGLLASGAGSLITFNSGLTVGVTLSAGGEESLATGATADGTLVSSGGLLLVGGGFVTGTQVFAGGNVLVNGGLVTAEGSVLSGGAETIEQGAIASDTLVLAGGVETVSSGGSAFFELVSSGGALVVSDGGSSTNATIASGGSVQISSGAIDDGTTVLAGGFERAYLSGATISHNVISSGATVDIVGLRVSDGAHFALTPALTGVAVISGDISGFSGTVVQLEDTKVFNASILSLAAGTKTKGIIVSSGGAVSGTGEVYGDNLNLDYGLVKSIQLGDTGGGHATLIVESGGVASAVKAVAAGDVITVESGGRTVGVRLTGAQSILFVDKGAVASATSLTNATQAVFGSAALTAISNGGVEYVEAGATASGAQVLSGGMEFVSSGGVVSGVSIASGGVVSVAGFAKAWQTTAVDGGALIDNGQAIWSGAGVTVLAGTLSGKGKLIQDGPGTLVLSDTGAGFTGQAVISGGVIELEAINTLGSATFDFAATAAKKTLRLGGLAQTPAFHTLSTTLIDFDSTSTYLDLIGHAFVSGATATLSGHTLTLVDGAYTASYTLSGHAASKYAVVSDGAGGTEIRAGLGSTITPLLVHAMAAFHPQAAAAPTIATSHVGKGAEAPRYLSPSGHAGPT